MVLAEIRKLVGIVRCDGVRGGRSGACEGGGASLGPYLGSGMVEEGVAGGGAALGCLVFDLCFVAECSDHPPTCSHTHTHIHSHTHTHTIH